VTEPACRRWRGAVVALLALVLAAGDVRAQEAPAEPDAPAPIIEPFPLTPRVPYAVEIRGVEGDLRDLLVEVSEARRLSDRPPPSILVLRRRVREDQPRLLQALRARGHYAATVEARIDQAVTPALVVFQVDPGPIYRFREITIEVQPPEADFRPPSPEALGVVEGRRAASQTIIDAERALLERARAQGFALAELGRRRAVVDHDADAMDLTLRLEAGPRARFGEITVRGLDSVEEDFVRGRVPWRPGDLVTPEALAEGRAALFGTELFSLTRITLGQQVDEEGRLPVTIRVEERPHRSISLGARYRSDEGPGGNVGWEHRNLLGAGERLRTEIDVSPIGYLADGSFRVPDFIFRDQALLVGAQAALEDTDAFQSTSIGGSVGLERILRWGGIANLGVAFRAVEVEDFTGRETFALLSLPGGLAYDYSDDLLDPSRGGRASITNEPFVDTLGSGVIFNRTLLRYTHYLQVLEEPRLVLAGRTALGTMFGADREDIPADERFYAGGGGSVRGFPFQLAGELDAQDRPLGGRSLFEVSGEVRLRITETIGGVAFIDAGSAFETQYPDFSEDLRIGTGFGLRYFSPIGPLRFDLAFPLNRRDADDFLQFYISVGQAF
jgi:translocation and assembly module TamA